MQQFLNFNLKKKNVYSADMLYTVVHNGHLLHWSVDASHPREEHLIGLFTLC